MLLSIVLYIKWWVFVSPDITLQRLPEASSSFCETFLKPMPPDGCGCWWLAAGKNSVLVWCQDPEVLLSELRVAFGNSLLCITATERWEIGFSLESLGVRSSAWSPGVGSQHRYPRHPSWPLASSGKRCAVYFSQISHVCTQETLCTMIQNYIFLISQFHFALGKF